MIARTAIVILNWNSYEMTSDCIRSLLAMKNSKFDIVVVDNGSKDDSVRRLSADFPEVTLLPQSQNLGFAGGCNVGMKLALERGIKYVLPLNNDTVVDPEFLTELEKVAEEHPRVAMVSPKIYFWDMPKRFWWAGGSFSLWTGIAKHIGRKMLDQGQFERDCEIDWATGCAVLIRTDVLKEVGLFDELFFAYSEDLDLSLRVRQAGYKIRYAPRAKLWHKEGAVCRKNSGESLRKFLGTRNLLFIMRKHARTAQWFTFLPNFLFRYVAFFIALSLARGDFRSGWAVLQGIVAFASQHQNDAGLPLTNEKPGKLLQRQCAEKDS